MAQTHVLYEYMVPLSWWRRYYLAALLWLAFRLHASAMRQLDGALIVKPK